MSVSHTEQVLFSLFLSPTNHSAHPRLRLFTSYWLTAFLSSGSLLPLQVLVKVLIAGELDIRSISLAVPHNHKSCITLDAPKIGLKFCCILTHILGSRAITFLLEKLRSRSKCFLLVWQIFASAFSESLAQNFHHMPLSFCSMLAESMSTTS